MHSNHSIETQATAEIQPEHVSTLPGRLRERIRLVKRFPNLQMDVAKRLRLKGLGGVNHVIRKRATSARIEAAIISEINRRIQAQSAAKNEANVA